MTKFGVYNNCILINNEEKIGFGFGKKKKKKIYS